MRADQALMLGGLGLVAAYYLLKAPKPSEPHVTPMIPTREPPPTPVVIPPGALPDQPGMMPAPPADIAVAAGPTLQLTPGSWYHGRIETSNPETPFLPRVPQPLDPVTWTTPREKLQQDLEVLGFGNVSVFMTPQEAAIDIFQPFALANPGKGTRWFRARLPAFLQTGFPPNPNIPRPPALVVIWRAAPPLMTVQNEIMGVGLNYLPVPYRYGQRARHSYYRRW